MADMDWGKAIVDVIVATGKESGMKHEVTRNFSNLDDEQMLEEAEWTTTRLQQVRDELANRGMELTIWQMCKKITVKVKRTVLVV